MAARTRPGLIVRPLVVLLFAVLGACADAPAPEAAPERLPETVPETVPGPADGSSGSPSPPGAAGPSAPGRQAEESGPAPTDAPSPHSRPGTRPDASGQARRGPRPSDGAPRPARLTVPALGITGLRVVPYRGWTDDAPGTRIQDGGLAASPHGPRGGVGPGGVGNYQVTAHRLSSTRAFEFLPRLQRGDRVVVTAGDDRFVYRIVSTRRTSFRSAASLRAQRAAVPGRPGLAPTRAMITLSTCATVEDHRAGNWWADEFGNPEHRIDKIGVLVDSRVDVSRR